MILDDKFFATDAQKVAKSLIGKYLVREIGGKEYKFIITETEAYLGEFDLASHARFGKTDRNSVMYGPCAHFYIYLIYGMHYMLNVVCGKEGDPQAVLIRGVDGIEGPGKLTKSLSIDTSLNGLKHGVNSGLYFENTNYNGVIEELSRVGIDYAGDWKDKLLRYKASDF